MGRNRFTLPFDLHNMQPGPAGVAAVQVIYKSEDGILQAYGVTVPADGTSGYAIGCIFQHVDGGGGATAYINEGSGTVSDFNLVITEDNISAQMAVQYDLGYGTAVGAGPSPLIWADAPVLEVMLDPTAGFLYFNDYLGTIDVTTADGYVITGVTTGGISPVVDEDGGVLLVDSQGNATADDGVNVQLSNCMFKPVAGRKIYFEARVKMVDTGDDQYFIGLAGIDTTLIAAGIMDDVVDKCGFFRIAASTADKISSIASRTTEDDATADVGDIVDATYVKLGFVIDGLTSVKFYVNGVLVETGVTTAAIPNAVMALSYVAQVEQTSADAELSIDWVRVLQTGARS